MTELDLHGARVRLRPLHASDQATMAAILAEPDIARWWVHEDQETAAADLFDDEDEVRLAIEVEGEVAGMIQFGEETTPDYRNASIDLFVGTAWQGRGIGSEAIRLVARHLFEERGHHRLTIDPAVANERAIRVYEKVGFRRVGVMRDYERHDGAWRDGLLMDLLRDDLIDE